MSGTDETERPHDCNPRPRPVIGKAGRGTPSERCGERPPAAILRGLEEFNRGEFFQQHETLEEVWIEENEPVRYLYQGILQVGVAMYHLERGNLHGAVRLLARGMDLLDPFRPACMGVDVERLVQDAARCLAAVRQLTPQTLATFDRSLIPRIGYQA